MIDWLNDNTGAVQAISVAALAIITAVYAWRTWSISSATAKQAQASAKMAEATRNQAKASIKMAEEMRRQRLSVSQPLVVPEFGTINPQQHQSNIRLNLTNVGNGPAVSLERKISHPSVLGGSGMNVNSRLLLQAGETWDATFVFGDFKGEENAEGVLEASWSDVHGQRFDFAVSMKWKYPGEIQLGDISFKVAERDDTS